VVAGQELEGKKNYEFASSQIKECMVKQDVATVCVLKILRGQKDDQRTKADKAEHEKGHSVWKVYNLPCVRPISFKLMFYD
jgi:hypothetical protein